MTSILPSRRRADGILAGGPASAVDGSALPCEPTNRGETEVVIDALLRTRGMLSICVLAVDGLAEFTETFGLEERRHLLSRLSALVRCNVRAADVLADIGAGSLALLLPATAISGAVPVADRLQLACRAAAWNCAPVSLSLGLVCALPGCRPEERLQAAESASRRASLAGGARVCTGQ